MHGGKDALIRMRPFLYTTPFWRTVRSKDHRKYLALHHEAAQTSRPL